MFRISGNTFIGEEKIMKRYLLIFLFLASTCYADVNQTGPYIVRSLQKQIENLTAENQQLKQQLADKDKEIEQLKSLCRKNDINVPISPAFTDSPKQVNTKDLNPQPTEPIIYRGQEQTKEWFEKMYKVYKDEIVYIDGKYQHKGEMKFNPILSGPAEVNSIIGYFDYTVIQVLGPGEALMRSDYFHYGPPAIFHLSGYKGPLVDGQALVSVKYLICDGIYEYTTTDGARATVQSFKVWQPEPITREKFAEALKQGIEVKARR